MRFRPVESPTNVAYLRTRLDEKAAAMRAIVEAGRREKRDLTKQEDKQLRSLDWEAKQVKDNLERAERAVEFTRQASEGRERTIEVSPMSTHVHPDAPITSRLFGVSNEAELRSLFTTTSSSAIATVQNWPDFAGYLANQSAALESGVRIIDTDATQIKVVAGSSAALRSARNTPD